MTTISSTLEWIKHVYYQADPRLNDHFLVSGISPLLMILVAYVYFCLSAGPKFMKDRKPYNLNNVLIVYNFLQVLLSIYIFKEGLLAGWWNCYKFVCERIHPMSHPAGARMTRVVYVYFISKLVELLDTVFFVFRKKQEQVSFLHIYHHTIMPITVWIGARYFPGGHVTFLGLINAFVHIIMYTYYMLAAFGPGMQKYLWWKKYITLLQITQFHTVLLQNVWALSLRECYVPKIILALISCNAVLFIYMFGSFYIKTYVRSKPNTKVDHEKLVNSLNNGVTKSETVGKNVARNKSD